MLFHGGENHFSFGCHSKMLWAALEQIGERMQDLNTIRDKSAVIGHHTKTSGEAFD